MCGLECAKLEVKSVLRVSSMTDFHGTNENGPRYEQVRETIQKGDSTKKRQTGINMVCSESQDQSDGKKLRLTLTFSKPPSQSDNSQGNRCTKLADLFNPLMRKKSSKFYWFSFPQSNNQMLAGLMEGLPLSTSLSLSLSELAVLAPGLAAHLMHLNSI